MAAALTSAAPSPRRVTVPTGIPAAAAGMRAIWVRRGPWGLIQQLDSIRPALVVDSLDELVKRIGEAWEGEA